VAAVGPNVNWPLWDSGRGRANERIARMQAAQADVTYRQTILLALREVADALIAVQKARELIVQQEVRVAAASEALRLGDLRYRAGVISYIEILDAQRQLFSAEIDLARSRLSERTAVIQLYLALGGGWSDEELKKRAATNAESE
jgi:multidrug efflux system outer membrane protein